jgi:hypothetical protein
VQTPPLTGEFFTLDKYDEHERKFNMKNIILSLCVLVIAALACDVSVNITPTNEVPTAAETPVLIEPPTTTPEIFISLTQAIPATPIGQGYYTVSATTDLGNGTELFVYGTLSAGVRAYGQWSIQADGVPQEPFGDWNLGQCLTGTTGPN